MRECTSFHYDRKSDGTDKFTYLGSDMDSSSYYSPYIRRRLGLASSTMGQLEKVWRNKRLSIPTTVRIYSTCVLPVLLYGSETWILLAEDSWRVEAFHVTCQRHILDFQWHDFVTNVYVQRRTKLSNVFEIIARRYHSFFDHVRLDPSTPAHVALLLSVDRCSGITPGSGWRRGWRLPAGLVARGSHHWKWTREYLPPSCGGAQKTRWS